MPAVFAFLVTSVSAQPATVIGRCPLERVTAIATGRFTTADTDDVLVEQDLGRMELSRGPGRDKAVVNLRRLALLRPTGSGLRTRWQSEPLSSSSAAGGFTGSCWTSGDIDSDGRSELLLFTADSCRVVSFEPDTVRTDVGGLSGAWVEAAICCDLDDDNVTEVATLELSSLDSGHTIRLLRMYRMTGAGLVPCGEYLAGLDWGSGTRLALLGPARLEDYDGRLPVIAGIHAALKPSLYGVLYRRAPDSLVLTTNPFPWQEWFSKTRVLPAGELGLFNVGDTLVGYGYFVPGQRPSGPSRSFAALEDGEWRLLPLAENARRLSGPVCRFTRDGVAGWLELRDNLFYFYPGDVFRWR